MVRYGTVWYDVVRYGTVWYGTVLYDVVWYGTVWYGMVWYDVVWYGTVRYGIVRVKQGMVRYSTYGMHACMYVWMRVYDEYDTSASEMPTCLQ